MYKKSYELLIFDWDGTLMDSVAHIVASMRAATAELGLAPRDDKQFSDIIGLGMREAINSLFPEQYDDAFAQTFTEAYRKYYFAEDAPQALFPNAENVLRDLHAQEYLLAVATGKSRRGLDKVLHETGLQDVFHASRCADETHSKPHPRMLLEILETTGVEPGNALMIGDTEYDLDMARQAGMHAVGVSYGVHDRERLQTLGPRHILDSIEELPDWLSQMNLPEREKYRTIKS